MSVPVGTSRPLGKSSLPVFVWPLLAVWIGLICFAAVFGPKLSSVVRQEVPLVEGADSLASADLVKAEFGGAASQRLLLVFASDSLAVGDPEYRRQVDTVLALTRGSPDVVSVTSYYDDASASLLGRDGKSLVAILSVSVPKSEIVDKTLPDLRERLSDARGGPVRFFLTGDAVIASDLRSSAQGALRRSERLAIPLVLLTLIVIFGSLVAAGIPLVLGTLAVALTSAVVYFLSRLMVIDNLAPSMISMMGMGVGVDYSLFLVSRFREELANGRDRVEAMTRTLATSGKAIAFSGATVVVSVFSLWIVKIDMMRTLSLAVTLVVISSVVAALTFLPCLLLLLGRNVDRLRLPLGKQRAAASRGFWHRWALKVMRRPWAYLFLVLIPLLALSAPALGLRTGFALLETAPPECESRQAAAVLESQFQSGLMSPIDLVVKVPTGTVVSEGNLRKLHDLAQTLKADPGVAEVLGITSLDPAWTYEDYETAFLDPPRQLAESTVRLGEGAEGLQDASAALASIRDGLRSMKAELGQLVSAGSGTPGAGAPSTLAGLAANLQAAAGGLGQVRTGLSGVAASTAQLSAAVAQARGMVASAKGGLEAMGPGAKADPAYPATYQSTLAALAILDGINPLTGQASGSLASALDQLTAGLGQSATALGEVEKGHSQAVAGLQAASGSSAPGPASLKEAEEALGRMSGALDQVIPGLGKLESQLRQVAGKSREIDLGTIMASSDLSLKLALSQASPSQRRSLEDLVNVKSGSNTAIFRVIGRSGPDEVATQELIGRLRETVVPAARAEGLTVHIGGLPAYLVDFNAELTRALPRVMALVLSITFIVLLVLLRSVVLPLKAVLMNALSVAASYGLLTLVFQHGYGARLIGLEPLGYLESPIILMLFAALFGLSMDYEVFLLSRVKEAYDRTGNNEEAVAEGLEQTAGIITGAAAIMIFVFGAFVFAGLVAMKEFGFGLAVAVALDATLIRIVLAPALMRLMGQWNWWCPKWLLTILPKVGIGH